MDCECVIFSHDIASQILNPLIVSKSSLIYTNKSSLLKGMDNCADTAKKIYSIENNPKNSSCGKMSTNLCSDIFSGTALTLPPPQNIFDIYNSMW
jgi:hypothetical protein